MIDIQISGAGAGKTYQLASLIINQLSNLNDHKKIYALTFTNSAAKKIETETIKLLGNIPENLIIQTVHSFFLNEIIYPFSPYILGDTYNECCTLNFKAEFKQWRIKTLKSKGVIHSDNVYNIAKQIIDQTNSKHSNKAKRSKVQFVLSLLSNSINSIFLDEAQDLDYDALRAFDILGKTDIYIYITGDPKQAIKYTKDFEEFINNVKLEDYIVLTPINNITRRVPSEILNISNRFCYPDQCQKSISKISGTLKYLESTHPDFINIITNYINSSNYIICIDKKTGKYLTQKTHINGFPPEIREKIANSNHKKDHELIAKAAFIDFNKDILKNNSTTATYNLKRKFSLKLENQEIAELINTYNVSKLDTSFTVSSIEAIKGLEADTCAIILTPNIYKYLVQKNLKPEEKFNKEWKKLYVALTRSKKDLILILDHELFNSSDLSSIKKEIENLGFSPDF